MDDAGRSGTLQPDEHGVYRWVYELHLVNNPVVFLVIAKIFACVMAGITVFQLLVMVPDFVQGYAGLEDLVDTLRFSGMLTLLMLVLAVVGYAVYAGMNGWKYCVLFTMDESGVEHRQLPAGYAKAQAVADLDVLLGLASGSMTAMGIGLTSRKVASYSDFANVRSVKGMRWCDTVKVNEPFEKNQVYVDAENYDFVYSYIVGHCPDAEVR